MSKFFRALEQASRDRAMRGQTVPPALTPIDETMTTPAGVAIEADIEETPAPAMPSMRAPEPMTIEDERALFSGDSDGLSEELVSLLAPASYEAEQYRALRHVVEQLHRGRSLGVIGVSSPGVGDGKTTTAINLAGALAQSADARVLLIDADLRRPTMLKYLGRQEIDGRGLVAGLTAQRGLMDLVIDVPGFNLSVLPAGGRPTVPYELFRSARFGTLIEEARARFEYVIVDTPPLVGLPDCRMIGRCVDGFIVVVHAHHTPRRQVAEAMTVLDSSKIIGLVFNDDERRPAHQYYPYGQTPANPRPSRDWTRAVRSLGGALRRRKKVIEVD